MTVIHGRRRAALVFSLTALIAGCAATETNRAIESTQTAAARAPYSGPRSPLVVGNFDNRSDYLRGMFSDGTDRLGSQAKTILVGHLQQSGRFRVFERDDMATLAREAKMSGSQQQLQGAAFAVTGDVTEFGRKEVGDRQLFGIFGRGKSQIAYSKVTLNVVDVRTAEVVYSAQGAGEYALSNREVLGFGSTAAYDSTLNGKVLDLAIREAVDGLVAGLEQGRWTVPAQ
jgi:curli biogenesis system outer membrane secretion channel CsgG